MRENVLRSTTTLAAAAWVAGLVGLGTIGLIQRDFALQWQPVPKHWPWREHLALISGLWLVTGGVLSAIPRARSIGLWLLTVCIGLWVAVLHLPAALSDIRNIGVLLGLAECLAITLGGYTLLRHVSGSAPTRTVRVAYGLAQVVFGLSHFLYPDITASMVPGWLPFPLFIAYFTGAIHAGMGLLLAVSRWWRSAVLGEALMMSSFVLLVHLPRVITNPDSRLEWTMFCVSVALTASAWLMGATSGMPRRE